MKKCQTCYGKDVIWFHMESGKDKDREKETGGSKKSHRFIFNSRYYTISIYTVITVLICAFIVRGIFMWEATSSAVTNLIRWSSPYLMGIFLACLLYPLVVFLEQCVFKSLAEKHEGLARKIPIRYGENDVIGCLGD